MVCEKLAGVKHDFSKDGLELIVENGKLHANGTTLGGDNGIAVALMMAVLDDAHLEHPPIECVFTTEEEVGLNGAVSLDKSLLQARTMINLDSEEEGVATVSCAGGMRYGLRRTVLREEKQGTLVNIEITGLSGGHSGGDIDKERRNANKLMARLLYRLLKNEESRLVSFVGGNKDNAIPRECEASLLYSETAQAEQALKDIQKLADAFTEEIVPFEPGFRCKATVSKNTTAQVLSAKDAHALIDAICLAPNGIRYRNPTQGNFVVTSLNLGVVRAENDEMTMVFAPRSSIDSLQEETMDVLELLAKTFGFETKVTGRYPGWAFAEHSRIRDVFCESYRTLFAGELKIVAIHAGLECGLFLAEIPEMDAIAVGPTIHGCHTPDEFMLLDSCSRFYQLLADVLSKLARN